MAKGFKGFSGGGAPNMNQLMQQAQRMQRKIEEAQEQAALITAETTSGGGVVKIKVNASHQIESLVLDPKILDPEDVEMVQDLLTAAINEAMRELDTKVEACMGEATGGGMPLGFGGF